MSREASSPPARLRSSERGGGSVSGRSSIARERASVSSAPLGAGEGEVACSQRTPPARSASSVASPRSSQDARRCDESRVVSEDRSFSRSSRVSRSSDRGTWKDRRDRSRSDSSRYRGRRSRSRSASRSRLSGRERRRRSLSSCERSRCVRSRSSDRSRSRGDRSRDRSRRDRSRSSDRYRSHDHPRRPRDCSRSRGLSPLSSDRSRSRERGRRVRREQQEGVETVDVSQATVVSEAPAVATPPGGGATLAALPSAVQDLARFFLNLTGSSSLGAVGGVAGVAAPASGVGVQLCPSALGGGAVAPCFATAAPAGLTGSPSALAAVPGMLGRQQRQETSRSGRRRRRSSSDGTDSLEEASEGSVSFPWSFFSPSGVALLVVLRVFGGCPSRGCSSQSWTCTWRYSRRFSPRSGG